MSNLSFRPRPLDVTKPIPIIRKELEEDPYDAAIGRMVPLMPTGMEEAEEAEKHLQELINKSILESASGEIPTPVVKVVEGYDTDTSVKEFQRPQSYIRVQELTTEEQDQLVDYDLDDEDGEFLQKLNSTKKNLLTEAKLEFLIDRFEKEASRLDDTIPPLKHMENLVASEKIRPQIIQIVYEYWVARRKTVVNPLLIRLLKPPEPDDPSPYKAFRPRNEDTKKRKSRKNDQAGLIKMRQVRHEMERARTLLEQIKKREKLKHDRVLVLQRIFELQALLLKQEPEKASQFIPSDHEEETIVDEPELPPPSPKPLTKKRRVRKIKTEAESAPLPQLPPKPVVQDIYDLHFDSENESDLSDDERSSSPKRLTDGDGMLDDMAQASTFTLGDKKIPPFRGRARIGRGGRILFDRRPPIKSNGIIHYLQTDEEYYPRLHSMTALYKQPVNPLSTAHSTDPEKLLKKLESLIEHKKKQDLKVHPNAVQNSLSAVN